MNKRSEARIIVLLILILGVMGVAGSGQLAAQADPSVTSNGDHLNAPSAADAPAINIWYGHTQTFGTRDGKRSDAQTWVNILGNVSPAGNIASLNYTLNGGPAVSLAMGPNTFRLAEAGDFNVELDYTELSPGNNTILITATDTGGGVSQQSVTVVYSTSGTTWTPGTYTWDWSTANKIVDLAQPIDGKWALDDDGVRATVLDFDRLLGLGDMSWRDYTVTVPITVYSVDASGYSYPSLGPGVGILTRWNGHFALPSEESPYTGWTRLGAFAWYRWTRTGQNEYKEGMRLTGAANNVIGVWPDTPTLTLGVTYNFKVQIQSSANPANAATYRFKMWPAADPEPAAWNIEGAGHKSEPSGGAFLLVAHHVDAVFGDVTVDLASTRPQPTLTVGTSGTGSGTVLQNPAGPSYRFGELVQLTAQPAVGSVFAGWSGDLASTVNPASIALDGNKTVTAIFEESDDCSLEIVIEGNGSVIPDPELETYECGANVTLEAFPETGHVFSGWSGGVTGTDNPTSVIVGQDTQVTATFEPAPERNLTVTIEGNGEVTIDPQKPSYLDGEVVTLTAVPGTGASFTGWSGDATGTTNPLTIVMNGDKAITAAFETETYKLTVIVLDGGGTVTTDPPGTEFAYGTQVQLLAQPADGFFFAGWSGGINSQSNPYLLTITQDMTINAMFQPGTATYSLFLPSVLDVESP